MNLLALDTSTEHLSLALWAADARYTYHHAVGNATSQFILPQIAALLSAANIALSELNGIAFGAGPGSFTGIRIAAGVTQGLAFGAQLPVVRVCTLLALAESSGASRVVACLDARMGEVYHAAYEKNAEGWQTMIAPGVYKPEAVPALQGDGWLAIGSGFNTYLAPLTAVYGSQLLSIQADSMPSANAILTLAAPMFARGETFTASEAMPMYIRNRVALTTLERQQVALK